MSKAEKVPNDVKSFLRSVLISSKGVKESRLEKDYHELSGEKLMWKNYGFKSLNEFLNALPDVCVLQYSAKDKENRVYAVQLEGTYMSSHAKKNAKISSTTISPTKEENVPENGRLVQKDGESFKITLSNSQGGEEMDDLTPNKNGLYQVYVIKLPEKCTENDLKDCFNAYGNVVEYQIVRSKIGKKIGFVRYALKNEASRALTEGKKNPPKIHGVELEVGKPKKKSNNNFDSSSNAASNSEPSEGSLSSSPSSPIKHPTVPNVMHESSTKHISATHELPPKCLSNSQIPRPVPFSSTHPTVKAPPISQGPLPLNPPPCLPENPPHNAKIPLSVQVPTSPKCTTVVMATTGNNGLWTLSPTSPTKTLLSIHPASQTRQSDNKDLTKAVSTSTKAAENKFGKLLTYGVVVSGYNSKLSEANLRLAFQSVRNMERLEYQAHYSIAWFKNEDTVIQAVNELNGKYINGCVLLVKPLTGSLPVMDEAKPANVAREEKLPGLQNEFSKIYEFYSEAISRCCGQQYLSWLNNLPSIFELKIMDVIDPCTYWVHLSDGTSTYQDFNDLTRRLSSLNPSSDLSRLNKNEFGAGKYSDDGLWYRCYCREASTDGRNVHVMYIDYGNTEWLEREKTVKLSYVFFELRPQGVLVKLSGLRFKSNNNGGLDNSVLSSAQKLLYQRFQARKASVDSTKPFLLEIELLHSKGEAIFKELTSLPGVETQQRESSPVIPLLLSSPPSVPSILKPLKDHLCDVNSLPHLIWITDIKSPTTFYFQLVRDESAESIRRIQEILLKCNVQNKVNVRDPKISGMVCYHKNGLERSRVTLMSSLSTLGKVTVLHVDTGKEAVVPLTSFIALPTEAKAIPFQARPAQLFGVPQDTLAQSSEALEMIILQATQVLRAIVVKENTDESVVVELFNSEGTNINKILLEMAKIQQDASNIKPAHEMSMQNQKLPSVNHNLSTQRSVIAKDELLPAKNKTQNNTDPKMPMFSSNSTRSQAQLPQNQAVSSSIMPSRNGVSPSSSSQVSPIQTPVQTPFETFPQKQASPNQAQKQASPNQASTRMQASPNQAQKQASPNQAQKQASPNQAQKQASPNQASTRIQASPNPASTRMQAQPNQAFGQNQPLPNQAFPQSNSTPNQPLTNSQAHVNRSFTRNTASTNQIYGQNQAQPNPAFGQNLASSQKQASPNQAFSPNQGPSQNWASPNQTFTRNQAPSQNQVGFNQASPRNPASPYPAFGHNQTLPQGQGQISPNQINYSSQVPHNHTFVPNWAPPNQGFSQNHPSPLSTNQAFTSKQVSPQGQISPNQNIDSSRAPQNRALGQNQAQHQKQPSPNQALSKGSTNQTFIQNRAQSNQTSNQSRASPNQAPPQNQALPNQTATQHQAVLNQVTPQNSTQNRAEPSQGQPAQTHNFNGPANSFTNTMEKTPQSSVIRHNNTGLGAPMPNSRFYNAGRPKALQKYLNSQNTIVTSADVSTASQDMTSQGFASQTNTPEGFAKAHSISQNLTSQNVTSHRPASQGATSQRPTMSQGITSQHPMSQSVTSQHSTASQGVTSLLGASTSLLGASTSQGSTSCVMPHGPTTGITSQGPTSQECSSMVITSQNATSQDVTSQESSSLTATPETARSTMSSPTQSGKSRSDSSASSASKNSFHSDENWDEPGTNKELETKPNLGEVQSPDSITSSDKKNNNSPKDKTKSQVFNKLQSSKPRSPTQSRKKPLRNEINSSKGGAKFKNSASFKTFPRQNLEAGGTGFANARKLQSLKSKLIEQGKVLSCSGEAQRQVVKMYKSREKLELMFKVKTLENNNLMLEGEIKRNLEEKAELEKQLKQQ